MQRAKGGLFQLHKSAGWQEWFKSVWFRNQKEPGSGNHQHAPSTLNPTCGSLAVNLPIGSVNQKSSEDRKVLLSWRRPRIWKVVTKTNLQGMKTNSTHNSQKPGDVSDAKERVKTLWIVRVSSVSFNEEIVHTEFCCVGGIFLQILHQAPPNSDSTFLQVNPPNFEQFFGDIGEWYMICW